MSLPKEKSYRFIGVVIDFETGGLKCQECAITQVSAHAVDLGTFETLGTFVRYVFPYNKKDIGKKKKVLRSKYEDENGEDEFLEYSEQALNVTGITMDMLREKGQPIQEVGQDLLKFVSEFSDGLPKICKPMLIGHNIDFDKGFFCQLMEYTGLMSEAKKIFRCTTDFYGNTDFLTLDTILLSQLAFAHRGDITVYKLEYVCEYLGINLDDAHDADADVTATQNVLSVITHKIRNGSGEDGDEEGAVMAKTEKTRKHFKI